MTTFLSRCSEVNIHVYNYCVHNKVNYPKCIPVFLLVQFDPTENYHRDQISHVECAKQCRLLSLQRYNIDG